MDVAIRLTRLDDANLVTRRLAPLSYRLCAAPSYLQQRGVPQHPDELRQHSCLVYGFFPTWAEWTFRAPGGGIHTVLLSSDGTLRTDSGITIPALVVAGCGITRLTTLNAADALPAGQLVEVLPDWPLAGLDDRHVWAVYAGNRAIPPKVRAFVDFLARYPGQVPPWKKGIGRDAEARATA